MKTQFVALTLASNKVRLFPVSAAGSIGKGVNCSAQCLTAIDSAALVTADAPKALRKRVRKGTADASTYRDLLVAAREALATGKASTGKASTGKASTGKASTGKASKGKASKGKAQPADTSVPTVAMLRAAAADHGVDLSGATRKAEIVGCLAKHAAKAAKKARKGTGKKARRAAAVSTALSSLVERCGL